MNGKRVLRVMRERGFLVRSRRLRALRRKDWGRVEAGEPNQIWQSDMTKIWAGPAVGWAYLVSVIDCCTREIVGWNLASLPDRRRVGGGGAGPCCAASGGQPRSPCDLDHRQWDTVHFDAIHRDPEPVGHHASAHGVSSSGGQQLHRAVPS